MSTFLKSHLLSARLKQTSWPHGHQSNAWLRFVLALLLICTGICDLSAVATDSKGRGLASLTQEHVEHIEKHWPKVIDVKNSKIGAARIREHLKSQGKAEVSLQMAASHHEEISHHIDSDAAELGAAPLPSHVDNSKLPSFPPIGDQGREGSCVAWASTYYQATHEIGLLNGINNKAGNANILSPKWTYNILNGGQDGGLIILDAYSLLSQNGAASIVSFPYDGDYLAWDLNPQDWIWAISKRTTPANLVAGLGGSSPQNLQNIKQLLNNGHVLTIGTYVDSWVFTAVGHDPKSSNNAFAGQYAASWMNGYNGGHCMTIVGYDDDVWIDINKNGVVDAGEKGAFLIANSWGPNWGNKGFVWVAYDAFRSVSAVSGGPKNGRVPLGDALNSYAVSVLPIAHNYNPKMIAQFSIKQSIRDQIAVSAGVSDVNQKQPAAVFKSGALAYTGGSYEFDGLVPGDLEHGTFAIDLTDLLASVNKPSTLARFYLLVTDNQMKHPTTLTSYSIIDKVHNKTVPYASVPIVFDGQQVSPYIDYAVSSSHPAVRAPLQVAITSPAKDEKVHGLVHMTVNATDAIGIERVEFYIDSVLHAADMAAPFIFSFDAASLSKGVHQLTVIAHSVADEIAQASISVQVDNPMKG